MNSAMRRQNMRRPIDVFGRTNNMTAVIGIDLPDCVWELAMIGDNRDGHFEYINGEKYN